MVNEMIIKKKMKHLPIAESVNQLVDGHYKPVETAEMRFLVFSKKDPDVPDSIDQIFPEITKKVYYIAGIEEENNKRFLVYSEQIIDCDQLPLAIHGMKRAIESIYSYETLKKL